MGYDMNKTISIGAQSFSFLRENGYFFVDKTEFIKEWWENGDAVTLITRPRRFGKTLNMDMLDCFFSKSYEGRADLFEGLSIWNEEKYREMQGSFPVIFLSFADVKATNFQGARNSIIQKLIKLFSIHSYVKSDKILKEEDWEYLKTVKMDMPDETAAVSINYLCDYLNRYYGKKAIILLDEYDTPLQEAYVNGYWNEMAAFIRSLFNSTFKTNPFLAKGLLTGITRVSKESIFSDLNNLTVVTTTSEKYSTQFGFTEKEVFAALESSGLETEKAKVKEWYDGFTFGGEKNIYNPWSITNFLKNREYKAYWANSSSNALAGELLRRGNARTKMCMEDLLAGKSLTTEIDEEIIFDQLLKKRGAVWSLFLASGYLKVSARYFQEATNEYIYQLKLTNREAKLMFERMFRDWFSDENVPYNEFIASLLRGNLKAMNLYMNRVAVEMFSFFDTGKKPSGQTEPERFYHGFVLGLMAELSGRYRITSNRESGLGRYDVMMEPLREGDMAFVLEFKVHDPDEEKTLEETAQAALEQIEGKCYDKELTARGIPKENIRHYGFAFEGKKVFIG